MSIVAPIFVTPLTEICVKVVAANFEKYPSFGTLDDKFVKKVIDNLPLDLPLELVGTLISDEGYWQRRACASWKNLEVSAHGNSWKQLFFEKNLQEVLEQFDLASSDVSGLRRLLSYSRRFVQKVHLRQLPSHLDLQIIFDCMVNSPTTLHLTYGLKNVGMDYDRSLFGMKLSDCRALARALERTETLTHLDLSSNMLDDDKLRMIASGLVDNLSITHLNISHNKVADRGMRALSKILDEKSVIAVLDVYDNHIHTEGGRALAHALKSNCCLLSLNLRLNRIGDDGCRAIFDALRNNTTLQRINISSNAAGPLTAASVAAMLRNNTTIVEMDLSCNTLGPEGGVLIRKAVEDNTTIQVLDLRGCNINPVDDQAIAEMLRARKEKRERAKILPTKS